MLVTSEGDIFYISILMQLSTVEAHELGLIIWVSGISNDWIRWFRVHTLSFPGTNWNSVKGSGPSLDPFEARNEMWWPFLLGAAVLSSQMSGDGPRRPCLWAEKPWLGRSEVMEITCLFGCGNKVNVKEVVWVILNGVWRFYEDSICQYVFLNPFLITSASVRKRSAINSWIRT